MEYRHEYRYGIWVINLGYGTSTVSWPHLEAADAAGVVRRRQDLVDARGAGSLRTHTRTDIGACCQGERSYITVVSFHGRVLVLNTPLLG